MIKNDAINSKPHHLVAPTDKLPGRLPSYSGAGHLSQSGRCSGPVHSCPLQRAVSSTVGTLYFWMPFLAVAFFSLPKVVFAWDAAPDCGVQDRIESGFIFCFFTRQRMFHCRCSRIPRAGLSSRLQRRYASRLDVSAGSSGWRSSKRRPSARGGRCMAGL